MRFLVVLAMAISLAITARSEAQSDVPSITQHSVLLDNGRTLDYTAQVGRLPIRTLSALEPHAYIGYVAYRARTSPADHRPIVFMWEGGPSLPSLEDDLTYGPKRIDEGKLADNPLTILSVADLVFVDPVGTGFSRPTKAKYGAEFYQVLGDQASLADFIRAWRALYDTTHSRIFLYGGSYGTWRVSGVAELLEKSGIRVTGAILKSGGIQLGADAQPKAMRAAALVPGRAAAALYHHLLPKCVGTTPDEVLQTVTQWALHVYAPALEHIDHLSSLEREGIAKRLALYTGYPVDRIDRKTLVVLPRDYLEGVLPGRTLDTDDMRVAVPKQGESDHRGSEVQPEAPDRVLAVDYLRRTLAYHTDLAYLPFDRGGYMPVGGPAYKAPGQVWDYNSAKITPAMMAAALAGEGPPGTQPWLKHAMLIDPRLRVLVTAGIYDSLNTCAGNRQMVAHQPLAISSRFTMKCYRSGRTTQTDPTAAPELFKDMRAWIAATSTAQ